MNEDRIPELDELTYLAGGDVDEFVVSLCLYGDDINPPSLSELLGVEPTQSHRKGERHGVRDTGIWKTGAWIYKMTGKAPVVPEDLVVDLLALLPMRSALWQDLTAQYKVVLRFGLFLKTWNREFSLSPAVVTRLAAIGAELDFDIYDDQPDHEHVSD